MLNRFEKGYCRDAGTDIILDKDIIFKPHTVTIVDLNIVVTPQNHEMIIVVPRSSAAASGLFIANSPVDPDYSGTIHAIVFNASKHKIKYTTGTAFAQLVVIPFLDFPKDYNVRKLGIRSDGKMGSTNK